MEITWQAGQGTSRTLAVHAIDLSNSGIRVESTEPVALHTSVYVRAERYGLTGTTLVRHCGRRGGKYLLGLEFKSESAAADTNAAEPFVDYYELLQISPNAEAETIHRVFRIMAARYHPDNKETGDSEKFLLLTKGYALLSDPARRSTYDGLHSGQRLQPLAVFGLKEFAEGLEGEVNRRLGILSLLYNRRRTNPEDPGISMLGFETVMSFPREHLEFAVWFLREKQYVRPGNNSDYVISATGVDYLESEVPSNSLLSKLLHAADSRTNTAAANADHTGDHTVDPGDPSHALALVRAR
jgi:curved DNA-binding protein